MGNQKRIRFKTKGKKKGREISRADQSIGERERTPGGIKIYIVIGRRRNSSRKEARGGQH